MKFMDVSLPECGLESVYEQGSPIELQALVDPKKEKKWKRCKSTMCQGHDTLCLHSKASFKKEGGVVVLQCIGVIGTKLQPCWFR